MTKYRKKPVVIEAVQFEAQNHHKACPKCVQPWTDVRPCDMSWGYIETLEGKMHVMNGDWIITGIAGENYPCKPAIFEQTYELVEEE